MDSAIKKKQEDLRIARPTIWARLKGYTHLQALFTYVRVRALVMNRSGLAIAGFVWTI